MAQEPSVHFATPVAFHSASSASDGDSSRSNVQPPAAAQDRASSDVATDRPDASPSSATIVDQEQIRRLVDEYLNELDEKKSVAAELQTDSTPASSGSELNMDAKWNHGLELTSKNKDFRVHIGGRFQFDSSWYSVPQNVQDNISFPYHDGFDFRRARFRMDGTLYQTMDWAAEFDFVNAVLVRNQPTSSTAPGFSEIAMTAPTDLWVQTKELPIFGIVRLGNQKEQIGFEHIVSSRFQPLMERSFNQDTFYGGTFNGFSPGLQFFRNYGNNEDGVISGGIFKPVNNVFGYSVGDSDYSVIARLTRLLWYENEGANLLHLGLSARQATATGNQGIASRFQVFRTRDAIRAGLAQDWPVPAGITLFGDDSQTINAEIAGVFGPWTLQGEYLVNGLQDARANSAAPTGATAIYHGGYIQLFRFLTPGDHEHYNRHTGVFDRVLPQETFSIVRQRHCGSHYGRGAWQMGARYNFLDLNDDGLNGGILHNLTTGLNWFWNPNMKLQFNYHATHRDVSDTLSFPAGSGWIHGFGTRMAFDF